MLLCLHIYAVDKHLIIDTKSLYVLIGFVPQIICMIRWAYTNFGEKFSIMASTSVTIL